jgi:hypothetical protein
MLNRLIFFIVITLIKSEFSLLNHPCSNRGNQLKNMTDCICMEGYLTYPQNNKKKCNYEIKSMKIAVFLSFFLGLLGADMFYLGYNIRGFVKFTLPILFLTIGLIYRNRIENKKLYYLSLIVPIVLLLFSWIYDILMISSGYLRDSNEIELIK